MTEVKKAKTKETAAATKKTSKTADKATVETKTTTRATAKKEPKGNTTTATTAKATASAVKSKETRSDNTPSSAEIVAEMMKAKAKARAEKKVDIIPMVRPDTKPEIKYEFKNEGLLHLALTQSGYDAVNNNERLEFIGDRVVGLAVADMLYAMYPNEQEGSLARRHAVLVSTATLAGVAANLGLGPMIRRGHMTSGKIQHMLADAMEAVIGAVFIDGGFDAARMVVGELWHELAKRDPFPPKDPKTILQEWVQKYDNGALPVYEYTEPRGVSHNPIFHAVVTAMGKSAEGEGPSKKVASTIAAIELLKQLDNSKATDQDSTEQKE